MRSAPFILWAMAVIATAAHGEPRNRTWFESSNACQRCHVEQHKEWRGSMLHYSAQSPVYQTFELTVRKLNGRFGVHDQIDPTFCNNCHSPIASYQNDLIGLRKDEPSINALSPLGQEGISCTMCHAIKEPHLRKNAEKGLLGDSMANADIRFYPSGGWVGPTVDKPEPEPNEYHQEFYSSAKSSAFLTSSQSCGSCHNVHLPHSRDTVKDTPFQVEQDTFGEWKRSAYASDKNAFGKVVSCQDCHMSHYGEPNPESGKPFPPASYTTETVAKGFARQRKHATHRFTGASVPLIENSDFDVTQEQKDRREQMLGMACQLTFDTPSVDERKQTVLPVRLTVLNSGAGHRVPTGLAQERELWLELIGRDADGKTWYHTGALEDQPHPETGEPKPDSLLHDEDLETTQVRLAQSDLRHLGTRLLKDFNLRPFAQAGVPTFNNAFLRAVAAGWERVYFFSLADHVDNTRSLPPLEPIDIRYDLDLSPLLAARPEYSGDIELEARLNYRSFHPHLLRTLAQREPKLLNEGHIDRSTIVRMATARLRVPVCPAQTGPENVGSVDVAAQTYSFMHAGKHWVAFFQPAPWDTATALCAKAGGQIATRTQYAALALSTQPGMNHDELWKERWTREADANRVRTHTLLHPSESVRDIAEHPLDRLPFFCVLGEPK